MRYPRHRCPECGRNVAAVFSDGPEYVLRRQQDGTTVERWFHRLRPHTRPDDGTPCACRSVDDVPAPTAQVLRLPRR